MVSFMFGVFYHNKNIQKIKLSATWMFKSLIIKYENFKFL